MTKKNEEMDENEQIMVCMDPLVLSGAKFCFCCVPTCMHCRLMTVEEYRLYGKLRIEQEKIELDNGITEENT